MSPRADGEGRPSWWPWLCELGGGRGHRDLPWVAPVPQFPHCLGRWGAADPPQTSAMGTRGWPRPLVTGLGASRRGAQLMPPPCPESCWRRRWGLIRGRCFPWLLGCRQLGGRSGGAGQTCSGKGGREQIPTGARDQPGSLGGWKTAPGASPTVPLGWERRRGAQPFPAKWGALPGEPPSELSRAGTGTWAPCGTCWGGPCGTAQPGSRYWGWGGGKGMGLGACLNVSPRSPSARIWECRGILGGLQPLGGVVW